MIYLELPFARVPINKSHPEQRIQKRQPIRDRAGIAAISRATKSSRSSTRARARTLFRVAAPAVAGHGPLVQTGALAYCIRFNYRALQQPKNKRKYLLPVDAQGLFIILGYRSSPRPFLAPGRSVSISPSLGPDETCSRSVIRASGVIRVR